MDKVLVKIKADIAARGNGFYDSEGGQRIYPPATKSGYDVDKEFTLDATPFVERKIRTGELLLIKRIPDKSGTVTKNPDGDAGGTGGGSNAATGNTPATGSVTTPDKDKQ